MRKTLLAIGLSLICNINAVELPEYSFAPSYNEHFVVEDYESEIVGSAERPFSGNWLEDLEDYIRMHGGIFSRPDPNWPSYVDPEYWEEFLNEYPEYQDDVEEYFDNPEHSDYPNNPFRLSLLDDTVGILILLIGGIAYFIYKARLKQA